MRTRQDCDGPVKGLRVEKESVVVSLAAERTMKIGTNRGFGMEDSESFYPFIGTLEVRWTKLVGSFLFSHIDLCDTQDLGDPEDLTHVALGAAPLVSVQSDSFRRCGETGLASSRMSGMPTTTFWVRAFLA